MVIIQSGYREKFSLGAFKEEKMAEEDNKENDVDDMKNLLLTLPEIKKDIKT